MKFKVHHLNGCSPTPLALYLKAIGILRLVAQQKDPDVRGWWENEHFCLLTKLDQEELEGFFLEEYSPTPFLSPWNKGSGFYHAGDPGLSPIVSSAAARFRLFREGIQQADQLLDAIRQADAASRAIKDRTKTTRAFQSPEQRALLRNSVAFRSTIESVKQELNAHDKSTKVKDQIRAVLAEVEYIASDTDVPPTKTEATRLKTTTGYKRLLRNAEREFKRLKGSLLPDCRRLWRGEHGQWMSAAVVLDDNGEPNFPSLLGTGGNDGNLDFTNNAMLHLGRLFDLGENEGVAKNGAAELLASALWSELSNRLTTDAIGQFLPGSGGGANSSTGTSGAPSINPWDFVLMMEGAVGFRACATRRLDSHSRVRASAPFVLNSHAAGHPSPGGEKDARGEQWLPLWSKPATFQDIGALFGDARLQLGRERANRPIDAARAISRLGVARGIAAFTRYGFLERNGQSTLAVPLGRISVQQRPRTRIVDDLAGWMNTVQRLARESNAPTRLIHAERRLADAVFAVLTHDDTPQRWQAVLEAAVAVESLQAAGTALKAGPIPQLQQAWVEAIHDNSAEVRLALALGSSAAAFTKNGRPIDPVRHHWLPLKPGARHYNISEGRPARDSRVVAFGRDPVADLAAVVGRRLLESDTGSQRVLPLRSVYGCEATLGDLAALVDGHVDLSRVLTLGRALMALDWNKWDAQTVPRAARSSAHPDEAWLALRLACLPWPIAEGIRVPAEPSLLNRLMSGDGSGAVRIAASRLGACGIRIPFRSALTDVQTARLWAAALAFPISRYSARCAVEILVPGFLGVSHA